MRNFDSLEPGSVIECDDITQMRTFEDWVAMTVDPKMTSNEKIMWEMRPSFSEFIRPRRFNGRIGNIVLELMENPYERLLDSRERGWFIPNSKSMKRTVNEEGVSENSIGFAFTADALSSGRGIIGQIQTEAFYIPTLRSTYHRVDGSTTEHLNSTYSGGAAVTRRIAKPKFETENFINLHEQAVKRGREVLKSNMLHPIIQGMHQ